VDRADVVRVHHVGPRVARFVDEGVLPEHRSGVEVDARRRIPQAGDELIRGAENIEELLHLLVRHRRPQWKDVVAPNHWFRTPWNGGRLSVRYQAASVPISATSAGERSVFV